jgi:hypothetical protein
MRTVLQKEMKGLHMGRVESIKIIKKFQSADGRCTTREVVASGGHFGIVMVVKFIRHLELSDASPCFEPNAESSLFHQLAKYALKAIRIRNLLILLEDRANAAMDLFA